MNGVAIRVHGLVNRFGEQTVHDGLDLDVREGEILGVVGGSGTGKSVLLRSIIGLHRPTEGRIEVFGEPVTDLDDLALAAVQRRWGVLFQNGALFSSLTVMENVTLPMREHTDLSPDAACALAMLRLGMVGLSKEAAKKLPSQLSGGMVKRVALARAMALDPRLLFLDEPTAGLDPIAASAFDTLIRTLQKALGLTVVIITHDLDTLFTICDRVAVLVDKRVVVDTVENLLQNDHPWIREYFHGPRSRAALLSAEAAHGE